MEKIQINPLVLIPSIMLVAVLSFFAGDKFSGLLPNPFAGPTHRLDFSSLNPIYSLMQRDFDGPLSDQKALDGAKAGLVSSSGDPYTAYLTADEAKKLSDNLEGKLSGIGAEIGKKNNLLTVIAPISGAPAEAAGVKAGDIIAKINNEDTTDMSVDTAVPKIRGPAGTKVTLVIYHTGQPEPITITITRADITVPSAKWSLKPDNVAYINVTSFGPDAARLVKQAATELKSQGATKVILDLRNNPGGYLDSGVDVASLFLKSGQLVVEERTGGKSIKKLTASGEATLFGLPTIVLINNGSASASEIVASALRDNNAAKLVGETSFGKGSVQEIKNLPDGARLKITVAHWYTPKGVNISKEGIKPDIETKLSTEDFNAGRDPQIDKALELLKQ